MLFHKSAIRTFGPFTTTTLIKCYDTLTYAKFFMAKPVIVFAVITCIGKHPCEVNILACLPQSGNEFGRIAAWAAGNNAAGEKICIGMADYGYFWPVIA